MIPSKLTNLKLRYFRNAVRNFCSLNRLYNVSYKSTNGISPKNVVYKENDVFQTLSAINSFKCYCKRTSSINEEQLPKNNFLYTKTNDNDGSDFKGNHDSIQNANMMVSSIELDNISKLYPEPKLTLHNFYQMLCSELGSQNYKLSVRYKPLTPHKKRQIQWECIFTLNWPIETKFSAVSTSKQDASKRAALKALCWLKSQKKITKNGEPVIEANKKDIASKHAPYEFSLDHASCRNMNDILNIYENRALPLFESLKHIDNNLDCKKLSRVEDNVRSVKRNVRSLKNHLSHKLGKYDESYPIFKYRDAIVQLVENNQVVIVKGEPGCGKSTQVPQYILDDWIENEGNKDFQVVVTQPRRIAAITLAEYVSKERNEKVGRTVGYQVRLESSYHARMGAILYCTTGILLKQLQNDPTLSKFSHVIIDEAHERDTNTDMLMVLLRKAISNNPRLKLIVMSATIDTTLFQNYYIGSALLHIPGFSYPVKRHYLEDIPLDLSKIEEMCSCLNPQIVPEEIAGIIKWIHHTKGEGAILCFLPGWDEINKVKQILTDMIKKSDHIILPLHSRLSSLVQKQIFSSPPPGIRKIILATNIAETSVTIDDVVYVIDCGMHKERRLHLDRGIESIDSHWVSQASVDQRAGRAGRVRPGESYHLFPKEKYQNMDKYSLPEIIRVSLDKIVLDSKVYCHDMRAAEFFKELPTPPNSKAIEQAVDELTCLNVLDSDECLTPLGKTISLFTLAPKLSKALIYSYFFRCVGPIVDIVTILSSDAEIFSNALLDKENVRHIKIEMSESSDHIALAKLLSVWRKKITDNRNDAEMWCDYHNINNRKMFLLEKLKQIHNEYLQEIDKKIQFDLSNRYSTNEEIIKGVLLSGVRNIIQQRNWDIVKGRIKKANVLVTKDGHRATLTSDSVNYKRKQLESPFLTYAYDVHSLTRRIMLIRETSVISPLTALLFLVDSFEPTQFHKEDELYTLLKCGKNIQISCLHEDAERIQKVAQVLNSMVDYFITYGQDEKHSSVTKSMKLIWEDILVLLNDIFLCENSI